MSRARWKVLQKGVVSRLSGGNAKVKRYIPGDGSVQVILPVVPMSRANRDFMGAMISSDR